MMDAASAWRVGGKPAARALRGKRRRAAESQECGGARPPLRPADARLCRRGSPLRTRRGLAPPSSRIARHKTIRQNRCIRLEDIQRNFTVMQIEIEIAVNFSFHPRFLSRRWFPRGCAAVFVSPWLALFNFIPPTTGCSPLRTVAQGFRPLAPFRHPAPPFTASFPHINKH